MIILHIISSLNRGGAELMLKRLIKSCDGGTFYRHVVISLTDIGEVGEQLQNAGVDVQALAMRSLLDIPRVLCRLIGLIRIIKPHVVQSWMYHADFLGGLAARLAGSCSVVWNIRCTTIPQDLLSATFWLVRLCAMCSYVVPHSIICCAKSAEALHTKLGYASHNMTVIPNGYDFSVFDRHLNSRVKSRMELGFDDSTIVIGVVGRFDPLKDFHNFVVAASYIVASRGDVKFLMVGRNIEWSNQELCGWIKAEGLEKKFQLVGEQSDVPYFLSAMDIFCLSSVCEGFPNVVAEAMAMGLPSVVTQAGDAADILGDNNFAVPVEDSVLLADALVRMCALDLTERSLIGKKNAEKVRNEYAIEKTWQKYAAVYDKVARK